MLTLSSTDIKSFSGRQSCRRIDRQAWISTSLQDIGDGGELLDYHVLFMFEGTRLAKSFWPVLPETLRDFARLVRDKPVERNNS